VHVLGLQALPGQVLVAASRSEYSIGAYTFALPPQNEYSAYIPAWVWPKLQARTVIQESGRRRLTTAARLALKSARAPAVWCVDAVLANVGPQVLVRSVRGPSRRGRTFVRAWALPGQLRFETLDANPV
jgi:hypothetical protein